MIENYFYESVKKDSELNLLWKNLWLEDELHYLEKDIKFVKKIILIWYLISLENII